MRTLTEETLPSDIVQNNKFLQVLLTARRAKQLINGDRKRIEIKSENPLTISMEEIRQEKIGFDDICQTPLFFEKQPEILEIATISPEETLSDLILGDTEEAPEEEESEAEAVEEIQP